MLLLTICLWMGIKVSKAQLSEIIQPGRFLGKTLGKVTRNLGKKALKDLAVPLPKDFLPKLATKATSSVLGKFERKISAEGAVRTGKGFTLLISNEDCRVTRKIRPIN